MKIVPCPVRACPFYFPPGTACPDHHKDDSAAQNTPRPLVLTWQPTADATPDPEQAA